MVVFAAQTGLLTDLRYRHYSQLLTTCIFAVGLVAYFSTGSITKILMTSKVMFNQLVFVRWGERILHHGCIISRLHK